MPGERALRVSERVYRALLAVYPKQFRDAYGPQMAQVFRDLCREEIGRAGIAGLVVLWARAVLDLLSTAFTERSNMLVTSRGFVVPLVSSPKMIRWGGIAAVVGGVLGSAQELLYILTFAQASPPAAGAYGTVYNLLGYLAGLLVVVGIFGLYAVVAHRSGRMASLGVLLACLSLVISVGFFMYLMLEGSQGTLMGPGGGPTIPFILFQVGTLIELVGLLLLGVVVSRTRALGRWSILPLALGLLIPLLWALVAFLVTSYDALGDQGIGLAMIRLVLLVLRAPAAWGSGLQGTAAGTPARLTVGGGCSNARERRRVRAVPTGRLRRPRRLRSR